MSMRERPYPQIKNQILTSLSPDEYERPSPHFEHVELPHRQVIIASDEPIQEVYFPNDALISLVTQLSDGGTVEAGVAGLGDGVGDRGRGGVADPDESVHADGVGGHDRSFRVVTRTGRR